MPAPRQIYASTLTRRERVWTGHRRGRRAPRVGPGIALLALSVGGLAGALLTHVGF